MKPRSKRNRKRPRSNVNALKDEPAYETTVRQLELDGKPIAGTHKWLRLIKPYPYTYSTYAKGRWEGRTIIDVYSTEFGSYPKSYYETAISQGRILVSDKKVSTSYVVKGGDVLSHTVHRHEPGVAVQSNTEPYVKIINETDELVVVSKPGTMPVHPCGGYSMQSLMNILEKHYKNKGIQGSHNANKLYTIHRLDRLTSGLVIIGKTSSVAQSYSKCIKNRSCQKIYLARVAGKFPLKYRALTTLTSKEIDQSGIPLHGEWKCEGSVRQGSHDQSMSANSKDKTTSVEASRLRKQYALSSWVTDQDGEPVFEDECNKDTNILERVFQTRHSVHDWLLSMDPTVPEKKKDGKLWFHLACPTRIAKHKDGVCEASSFDDLNDDLYIKSVKPAHSAFGVVSYDKETDSTLLICRPYTGRTHQLRLHLQHLEHPIANDPNYGGDIWYGNPEGRRACEIAEGRLSVINTSGDTPSNLDVDNILDQNNPKKLKTGAETIEGETNTSAIDVPATEREIQRGICTTVQEKEESIHAFIERTCVWCARCRSVPSTDRAILEFLIRTPGIWLHALQYSFPGRCSSNEGEKSGEQDIIKTFRADLPDWHDL